MMMMDGDVHHHIRTLPYGTTSLDHRSRSPSPTRRLEMRERERDRQAAQEMGMQTGERVVKQQQQISDTAIVSHSAGRYRRFQPLPGQYQHSLAEARRLHARRLPPTPRKPSTLQLASTNSINFPHVSASPTRAATLQRLPPVVRDHAAYGAGVVGVVGAAAAAAAAVASSRDRERDPLRRRMHEYNQYAPAAYEYRDREREQFERERNRELEQELEQDLERERWNSLNVFFIGFYLMCF